MFITTLRDQSQGMVDTIRQVNWRKNSLTDPIGRGEIDTKAVNLLNVKYGSDMFKCGFWTWRTLVNKWCLYKHDTVSNNSFSPVFIQLLSLGDSFEPGEQLSLAEAESGREAVPDAVVGGAGQVVHEADGGQYLSQRP